MNNDEAVILGHHLDDQIETFLYRLFRGSSPLGLSVMKRISKRDNVMLCRPLLCFPKEVINYYSKKFGIDFFHDSSNDNLNFERNYIRKKIIPNIKERWPSFHKTMRHNITLQDTHSKIAGDFCNSIYDHIVVNKILNISTLLTYPSYLYSIFIKHWIYNEINYKLNKNEAIKITELLSSKNSVSYRWSFNNCKMLSR